MIRRGKAQGWLSLPSSSLRSWAVVNELQLRGVEIGHLPGHENKGAAIRAQQDLSAEQSLMVVPHELILSLEAVQLHAKSDRHLRDVLDSTGDFARVRSWPE